MKPQKDLSYKVPHPHFLRLTLEDCALCLKNLTDPVLYSTAIGHSDDLDTELCELQDARESMKEHEDSCDDAMDVTGSARHVDNPDILLSNLYNQNTTFIEVWLTEYFEEEEGGSVARCEIYNYYLGNCQKYGITPCNPANFGKSMRLVFPNIQTRRIGIRGRSKYHYVGIAPRIRNGENTDQDKRIQDHPYKDNSAAPQNAQDNPKSSDRHDNICEILKLLSGFPEIGNIKQTTDLKEEEVSELLHIYKLHAVQIITNIIDADFYKVKDTLMEFWKSLPQPLFVVIGRCDIIELIETCDRLIYKVVGDMLIPDVLKSLPIGLMHAVVNFGENFQYWLEDVLSDFPVTFRERKIKVCNQFRTSIQRQINISHMVTSARFILHSHDCMKRLLQDWQDVDVNDIVGHCQNLFTNNRNLEKKIRSYMVRLQQLMIQNSTIDQYMAWIKAIVDQNVQNITSIKYMNTADMIKEFILNWSYVSGQIIHQLSINTASTLGSFHLLDLLFKDYALHLLEEWIHQ